MPPTESFWTSVAGEKLAQGDYLLDCAVPKFPPDYSRAVTDPFHVPIGRGNLIIVTQSCDLDNKKVPFASLCPILAISDLEKVDERYGKADRLEEVRKGRIEALHMLSSPDAPDSNQDIRIVDFREIYSLPVDYLAEHAKTMGTR